MSRKIIIIIVFSYVLSVFLGGLMPKYREVRRLRSDLNQQRRVLLQREDYLESLTKTLEEKEERKEELKRVDQGLPPEAEISSLLELLQKSLTETGLIFKQIGKFSKALVKNEGGVELWNSRISIEVSGSYDSFKSFLEKIERSAYIVEVDGVSFEYDEEKGGSDFYNFKVSLRTRFIKFNDS